jgi:ubiquinol-cytochrome c reductase cytochrome c1 subunit
MLIEIGRTGKLMRVLGSCALALLLLGGSAWAADEAAAEEGQGSKAQAPSAEPTDWESWKAGTSVANAASLQRGARNFAQYCMGCHSLKYVRWSRIGTDLNIPANELQELIPAGDTPASYLSTPMPAQDAENWFGKVPPDLSLMAAERGKDYIYRLFKTFYVDPTKPTGTNNLQLPNIAMPNILSSLEGLKKAVYKSVPGADGKSESEFDHFEQIAPGSMTEAQYDAFVRDTVNFLDYASEPTQMQRHALGLWVVLFLLVLTWLAWLMKQEYWKDVQ